MLAGPDWLKAHKGDLHRQDQADDVEGAVGWKKKKTRQHIYQGLHSNSLLLSSTLLYLKLIIYALYADIQTCTICMFL